MLYLHGTGVQLLWSFSLTEFSGQWLDVCYSQTYFLDVSYLMFSWLYCHILPLAWVSALTVSSLCNSLRFSQSLTCTLLPQLLTILYYAILSVHQLHPDLSFQTKSYSNYKHVLFLKTKTKIKKRKLLLTINYKFYQRGKFSSIKTLIFLSLDYIG